MDKLVAKFILATIPGRAGNIAYQIFDYKEKHRSLMRID